MGVLIYIYRDEKLWFKTCCVWFFWVQYLWHFGQPTQNTSIKSFFWKGDFGRENTSTKWNASSGKRKVNSVSNSQSTVPNDHDLPVC